MSPGENFLSSSNIKLKFKQDSENCRKMDFNYYKELYVIFI